MALLKFIFAVIVGVLLFSHALLSFTDNLSNHATNAGMGSQSCIGTCKQYPNCDSVCKKRGFLFGFCVPDTSLPVGNYTCCCAKNVEV
ncbi:unnamed protein product [Lupinus luteus]|uniref:Uncharacterized protein n=1 Tax=Lupinus luteus TaxID=3873 RepID=A0AAV1X8A3_LUPLU